MRNCSNCKHKALLMYEEPCVSCSHRYNDHWELQCSEILEAAKAIKKFCTVNKCVDCPFYDEGHDPVCLLAPKDDNNIPRVWRLLS